MEPTRAKEHLFYRNPRLTALTVGLVMVAGLSALGSLARQEDPTLARRFALITTYFPGASALRVETLVTEKIETEIRKLHEVKEISSTSRAGVSVVFVELADHFSDDEVDEIWSKARDRLADAEALMPPGTSSPDLEDRTTTAVTVLASFVWTQDDDPQLDILTRLAEELENRLRNLANTKETEIFGEADEEIRVSVDPVFLASLNLTAGDVSAAIARADSKVPAGQLRHGRNDLLIEVDGELRSVERIARIPLRREADGRFLRVGDVARVDKTIREPAETLALVGGRRAVVVAATMTPDRRVDRWAEEARRIIDGFRAEVPTGIALELSFDQSGYTEERLATLALNLLLAAMIVTVVVFFMMGLRSAFIVGLALPLTVAMVLAEFNAIGMPLHQTSVTGLIIALGLLIDNAIVVVDEYNSRLREGATPGVAVAQAVRHLFVPLLASTLTTVLAFLPIVLAPGGVGEFVGPISVGVALAVVSSFFLAMTVIPALAARLTTQAPPEGGPWWRGGYSDPRLADPYRRSIRAIIRRPWVGVAVAMVLPVTGFVLGTTLTEQFFPPNDRNQFQLQLVMPSHASVDETRRAVERARELVMAHEEVVESDWFVGEQAPRVFYNMLGNQDGVRSFAGAYVTTLGPDETERLLPPLQAQLMDAFPEAMVLAIPFEQGPPFDAPIEVRVIGPDLDTLRSLGEEIRAILARTDRVTYTAAQIRGGQPKLVMRTDEDEARLAGLELVEVARQLEGKLEGSVGGSVLEANEEIPVRVRVERDARSDLAEIASDYLLPAQRGGQQLDETRMPGVPLAALSEFELVPELAGITRRDGERSNTVQAHLEPYALIAESLADFRRRLDASGFQLPPGYRLEFGGETEQRSEAMANMIAFAVPLFVVMAGTIILSFNSFRFALVIFSVAFLSIGLALLGVWLFGYPMGFLAIVGTMGLVGLAINGGIVVLSALRADPRALDGDPEAIERVVMGATRHILSTTLTTIGGFIPLIVLGGRFWPPLATAIAGGVGGSAILALYFVPSVFVFIVRRHWRQVLSARPLRMEGSPARAA